MYREWVKASLVRSEVEKQLSKMREQAYGDKITASPSWVSVRVAALAAYR